MIGAIIMLLKNPVYLEKFLSAKKTNLIIDELSTENKKKDEHQNNKKDLNFPPGSKVE